MLAAVLVSHIAIASPAVCNMRLSVELTPDVPNPVDLGFLSSPPEQIRAGYRLTLQGWRPGSVIVIELTGSGPDSRCQDVVEAMRKDGPCPVHPVDQEPS